MEIKDRRGPNMSWSIEEEIKHLDEMAAGYPIRHGDTSRIPKCANRIEWLNGYLDGMNVRHLGFRPGTYLTLSDRVRLVTHASMLKKMLQAKDDTP